MREQGDGKILITGSIAGFMPGTYQAVYNGTKAFSIRSPLRLRDELKDTRRHRHLPDAGRRPRPSSSSAPTCWTPRSAPGKKDDPADVAKDGFDAMMDGDGDVVSGWQNKLQVAAASNCSAGNTWRSDTPRWRSPAPRRRSSDYFEAVEASGGALCIA